MRSFSHKATLDLGALGALDVVLEAVRVPASPASFDGRGTFRPASPSRIEVSRVLAVGRDGRAEHAPDLEALIERLGFDLEAHFAGALRQAAEAAGRNLEAAA